MLRPVPDSLEEETRLHEAGYINVHLMPRADVERELASLDAARAEAE